MANRTFYPAVSYGFGRVYGEFIFTPNGSGTPSLSLVDGSDMVSTLAHTGGTQIITVTLKDAFNKVVYGSADVRGTAGTWCTIGAISNEATSTPLQVQIYYWQAGGSALNDPTTSAVTQVTLALRNSASGMK
jgi:hypothetical protein